jgi:hypothetical protein
MKVMLWRKSKNVICWYLSDDDHVDGVKMIWCWGDVIVMVIIIVWWISNRWWGDE